MISRFNLCLLLMLLASGYNKIIAQNSIEQYEVKTNDSIRIGSGENDFLPLIQKGYTLMLPEENEIKGVLIFLEDSGYDERNKSAKQIYKQASKNNFAVLSVSTKIPFDFYFSEASILSAHQQIKQVFFKYNLPNENIFFLGAGLTGHRALKYIEFTNKREQNFKLQIKGIVLCNLTLDWTRKWKQHKRDIRINRINLWESNFINYVLETNLKGTPETASEHYHNFSTYSYFDATNRNIKFYKNYAIRAYIEPAITYRLQKYYRTLYENNATDVVGFLAELELAGNENTELIVFQSDHDVSQQKNTQSTWNTIDKDELMTWILKQVNT